MYKITENRKIRKRSAISNLKYFAVFKSLRFLNLGKSLQGKNGQNSSNRVEKNELKKMVYGGVGVDLYMDFSDERDVF